MDNLIGKTLDGLYTIRELIGTGGMANVYKAVVTAPGGPVPEGTVVAVKVLRHAHKGTIRHSYRQYYIRQQVIHHRLQLPIRRY